MLFANAASVQKTNKESMKLKCHHFVSHFVFGYFINTYNQNKVFLMFICIHRNGKLGLELTQELDLVQKYKLQK